MTEPTIEDVVIDDGGGRVQIVECSPQHRDGLQRLYRDYPPEHRSLGLPPLLDHQLEAWLSRVLDEGENFVAVDGGAVLGHAVYAPADADVADFVVFVDPAHHGRGIGTALLEVAIGHAAEAGVDRIVSHAEAENRRALHVYDKVGFERLEDEGLVVKVGIDLASRTGDDREPD